MIDYKTIDADLSKMAQVQAILWHIVKYHLPQFDERMQREVKQAALDVEELRPKFIKYISHYFANLEVKRINEEVKNKLSEKQG
jgi:hypothetical protein